MNESETGCLQLTESGKLRHLLTLRGLRRDFISDLLDRSEHYQHKPGTPPSRDKALDGRTVVNLFFEPSTRTRASFELAAKRMSADVLNLDVNMSSRKKGESILDTIYTLQALQADVFVVRDASAGIPEFIARNVTVCERAERRRSRRFPSDPRPSGSAHDTPAQAESRWLDRNGDRRPQTFASRTIPGRGPLNHGAQRIAPGGTA